LKFVAGEVIDIEKSTRGLEQMGIIQLYREHPQTYEAEPVGTITEHQLDFLIDNLEEEFEENEECFLLPDTIDYLKNQGADGELISILQRALAGNHEGVEIFYTFE
jgi:hypothetical protein